MTLCTDFKDKLQSSMLRSLNFARKLCNCYVCHWRTNTIYISLRWRFWHFLISFVLITDLWPILLILTVLKNGRFLKKCPILPKNGRFHGIGQRNRPCQNLYFQPSKRYIAYHLWFTSKEKKMALFKPLNILHPFRLDSQL